jgi:hypothetical protein
MLAIPGQAQQPSRNNRTAARRFFLGGRFAPDEKRRHAWNADRQNSKMLCRQLRIAQCNGAPILRSRARFAGYEQFG